MSRRIARYLRLLVAERAGYRCEYCRVPELFLATVFHVDHIRSLKHGGLTVLRNLAFCCPHCNQNKGSDIATFTNLDGEELVRFFNPRTENWHEHFLLKPNGKIAGLTPIGSATARILEFNRPDRTALRFALIEAGRY